jgi:UDP-glucose 4-epimerase
MTTPGIAGETFNISSGRSKSLVALLKLLEEMLTVDANIDFHPPRKGDIRDSLADISRAVRGMGFQPSVSFEEGLGRSIAYYRTLVRPQAV